MREADCWSGMDKVFEPSSGFQRYSIVPGTNGNVATGPGVNEGETVFLESIPRQAKRMALLMYRLSRN